MPKRYYPKNRKSNELVRGMSHHLIELFQLLVEAPGHAIATKFSTEAEAQELARQARSLRKRFYALYGHGHQLKHLEIFVKQTPPNEAPEDLTLDTLVTPNPTWTVYLQLKDKAPTQ